MTGLSIVVSGPPAVGKTTLAKALAGEFGLQYVSGGDVLKVMAEGRGFATGGDDWWDTQDGMNFLRERERDHGFDRTLDAMLLDRFAGGGVAVTSYTLPWLAKSGGIKIWLDASHESSMRRMQARDGVTPQDAYRITGERYDKNRALYKKMYGFDFGADGNIFDLIINTDDLTIGQVADLARKTVLELM